MGQKTEVMSQERLDHFIKEAAKAAGYEEGFGVPGCDLSLKHWTVAYNRQSSEEQAKNDRLGEYLLTCAKLAKQIGAKISCYWLTTSLEDAQLNVCQRMIKKYGKLLSPEEIKRANDPNTFPPAALFHYRKVFQMPHGKNRRYKICLLLFVVTQVVLLHLRKGFPLS